MRARDGEEMPSLSVNRTGVITKQDRRRLDEAHERGFSKQPWTCPHCHRTVREIDAHMRYFHAVFDIRGGSQAVL